MEANHPSDKSVSEPTDRFYSQVLSGGMHSPFWTINGQVYPNNTFTKNYLT